MQVRLERAKSMLSGETRVFPVMYFGYEAQGFLLHYKENFFAYLNRCCHWPIPLDYGDADFFYPAIDRIICKSHGAEYHPETGICEAGPCQRAKLLQYPISWDGDDVLINIVETEKPY